jgi:hypothetical protein
MRCSKYIDYGSRLVVLKYGTGGAAKLMTEQPEVLEYLTQRAHINVTGKMPVSAGTTVARACSALQTP